MSGAGSGSSKRIVALAALVEIATGVAFLADPALVVGWLLGVDLTAALAPLARVAGIALLSFGVACWPGDARGGAAFAGLLIYNFAIVVYLTFLRTVSHLGGPLLWPGVALHAVLTLLLIRACRANGAATASKPSA